MRVPIFSQKSNRWPDQYNPLRGLSMPRLVSLLEAGERGQYADLQWLYHYMERSDAMIASVMQRRRAALLSCDWDIREVSGVECRVSAKREDSSRRGRGGRREEPDAELAEEQTAGLKEAYDGVANFQDAVGFLFSGFFRGYGHVEKHFGEDGAVVRLEPVEQPSSRLLRYDVPWWFWVRDGLNADRITGYPEETCDPQSPRSCTSCPTALSTRRDVHADGA